MGNLLKGNRSFNICLYIIYLYYWTAVWSKKRRCLQVQNMLKCLFDEFPSSAGIVDVYASAKPINNFVFFPQMHEKPFADAIAVEQPTGAVFPDKWVQTTFTYMINYH